MKILFTGSLIACLRENRKREENGEFVSFLS
jgi:hypothetical protein